MWISFVLADLIHARGCKPICAKLLTLGSVNIFYKFRFQSLEQMNSASNRSILKDCFQVLHVPVLLIAPLGAGHLAQPGTDQHKGGIAVPETAWVL